MFSRSISRSMNPGAMFGRPHASLMHRAEGGPVELFAGGPLPMSGAGALGQPGPVPLQGRLPGMMTGDHGFGPPPPPMSGAGALGQPGIATGVPPAGGPQSGVLGANPLPGGGWGGATNTGPQGMLGPMPPPTPLSGHGGITSDGMLGPVPPPTPMPPHPGMPVGMPPVAPPQGRLQGMMTGDHGFGPSPSPLGARINPMGRFGGMSPSFGGMRPGFGGMRRPMVGPGRPMNYQMAMAEGGLARAADAARGAGRFRDQHLVHLNPEEYGALKESYGEPTTNPHTGLPEFFSISDILLGALGGGLGGGKNGAISGALMTMLGLGPKGPTSNDDDQTGVTGSISKYLPKIMTMASMMYKNKNEPPPLPGNITARMPGTSYNRTSNTYPGGTSAYYTYGTRPSFDFYDNNTTPQVQGQAHGGPIRGIDDAGPSMGSHYMGSSAPGGGTADTIPARLSNNEYVMDAQTMAMLGDGSPDEGARKMDKMRANLRKHKGRALAKGKMAPNARNPEDYLE